MAEQYDVLKAFNTVNRRLVPGGSISAGEPLEPYALDERVENGFLKLHEEEPSKKSEPGPDPVVPPTNELNPNPPAEADGH